MDEILRALGDIVVKALPTFFLLIVLHFFLKHFLFRPLERVLHAREAATEGARKEAAASLERAARRAGEYEQALAAARSEIYKEQEERRKQWRDEQSVALDEARRSARGMVQEARVGIAAEAEAARSTLAAEADALAEQIAGTVIERTAA